MGRVQLKYYDERCVEIRKAMNYFWDLLEGVPGVKAHRVDESTGSNMAGWYAAHGLYVPEDLEGLSVTRFCEALRAEGVPASPGCNAALHSHQLFQSADVFNEGKPTRIANADRDVRELDKDLEVSEANGAHTYSIPWFKHYWPEVIEQYANAFKKVCANYKELLAEDPGNPEMIGGYHFFNHSKKSK
jgi:dTDP-4-amino-4,6-dideoxygalactose transaminase